MGVLYDYFRAADDNAVGRLIGGLDGDSPAVSAGSGVDAVEAKGIDPDVVVGKLAGFVLGVRFKLDIADGGLVWPAGAETDRAYDGPWVVRVGDQVRDALAGLDDADLPELADRWGRIEELSRRQPLPDGAMLPVLTKLTGLARRAAAASEHLYCWMCV